MKHKFSLFFKINAWLFILTGLVFVVLSFQNKISTNSSLAVSAFYCAATFFIIDYVIQMLFDCRNFLKQLASQTGSYNNVKSNSERNVVIDKTTCDDQKSESIWKMNIGNGSWFILYFIAFLILLAIILIITAR